MYNIDYYYNLLRKYAATGEKIAKIRWEFVKETNAKIVLDYGCGVPFFAAWKPENVDVDTYDIMPVYQNGIQHKKYDLITFFDVLEHMISLKEVEYLFNITEYIALTIPIKPDNVKMEDWFHTKPGEHLSYFSHQSIVGIFKKYNFGLMKSGTPEVPPRLDIESFLFQKV